MWLIAWYQVLFLWLCSRSRSTTPGPKVPPVAGAVSRATWGEPRMSCSEGLCAIPPPSPFNIFLLLLFPPWCRKLKFAKHFPPEWAFSHPDKALFMTVALLSPWRSSLDITSADSEWLEWLTIVLVPWLTRLKILIFWIDFTAPA